MELGVFEGRRANRGGRSGNGTLIWALLWRGETKWTGEDNILKKKRREKKMTGEEEAVR